MRTNLPVRLTLVLILLLGVCAGAYIFANAPKRPVNTFVGQTTPREQAPETPVFTQAPEPLPVIQPAKADPAPKLIAKPAEPKALVGEQPHNVAEIDILQELPEAMRAKVIEMAGGKTQDVTVNVSGRVIDDAGNPAAGAKVYVELAATLQPGMNKKTAMLRGPKSPLSKELATTDANGNYRGTVKTMLLGEHFYQFRFSAGAAGYTSGVDVARDAVDGAEYTGVDLAVGRGATLEGRVVDGSGRPIQGAHVYVFPKVPNRDGGGFTTSRDSDDDREALRQLEQELRRVASAAKAQGRTGGVTDADGHFSITGISCDATGTEFTVTANAQGYLQTQAAQDIELRPGETRSLPQPIVLDALHALTGSVSFSDGSKSGFISADFIVDGDKATKFSRSGKVDKDGKFTIKDVPAGTYTVTLRVSRLFFPSDPVVVVLGAGLANDMGAIVLQKDPNAKPYPMRGTKDGEQPGADQKDRSGDNDMERGHDLPRGREFGGSGK